MFQILENYQADDENIELLSAIFMAADMFQMTDLESAVLQLLASCCNPNNCLTLYQLVKNLDSLATLTSPAVKQAKQEVIFQ